MICIEGVCKRFGTQEVLKNVSFRVRRGTTRAILGLSGSGKSVLMRHLIGLMLPDAGRVVVDGVDLNAVSHQELLQIRRKFGMVFQQAALFDSLSVGDNVGFPLREHTSLGPEKIAEKVAEKLKIVGLSGKEAAFPAELSGGMRKRVGLARAIILDPTCVLYDEPTTGLDPLTTDNVDTMIMDAKQQLKVTSVVISHDVGSALKVADDIAFIHRGEIVEDCPKDKIRQSTVPFVQEFLGSWFNKQ
jgi:phospholipid/cholesterol/gamma-HCH transport system ATP-binding protein